MKKMRKIMALVIAMTMMLAMGMTAMAQTVGTAATGKGSITISNAAKGETYGVVKLFDATLSEDGEGIAYTGNIPDSLKDYFTKDSVGNIHKVEGKTDEDVTKAVQAWAAGQEPVASGVSDGSALTFEGLDYGYYAVQTTQGATITVTSTNPNVTVVDKNSKKPSAEKKVNGKDADSASIGEVVTYTATFNTANYIGAGENAWKVESYTIADTLPEFLTDVHITGLKIVQDAKDATKTEDLSSSYTEFTNKKIIIPWVDNNGDSLYKNGSVIELTYTAKVTGTVNVNTANTNIVSITPNKDKEGNQPHNESWDDNAVIKTYGTALKKIDGETKAALKGAEFTVAGLVVEEVTGEPGVYKVVSYDPNSTTASAAMTTNDEGMLYIIGLKDSVTLSATETKAPEGYNLAEDTISLPAQQLTEAIYETSGERYYDEKGNLVSESSTATTTVTVDKNYTDLDPQAVTVENNKGSLLPSTGGMGTTIFYLLGGILVIGAAIMLIARRRVESEK